MKTAAIYDFVGNIREAFEVTHEKVSCDTNSSSKGANHHILVIDRSGSMYYDIEALKDTVIKILTIGEYDNENTLVSLVSYSSTGDCGVHFSRTPISEVMATGSPYIKEIKKIRATCLTCISQALEKAESLIDDGESTAITLHSDGFANDPSPRHESENIAEICERLSKKNVFVNTIAYSNYSDFVLLSKVANDVSGMCIQANSSKDVYDAIAQSSKALSEGSTNTIEVDQKDSDYLMFVSKDPRKIVGGSNNLTIRGVGEGGVVIRFKKISDTSAINEPNGRLADPIVEFALLAMAKSKLAAGDINYAKYAMMSSMNLTLTEKHSRALTPKQIAEMATDLDQCLFVDGGKGHKYNTKPGLKTDGPSVIELASVLNEVGKDVLINVDKLASTYVRKGLKKIAGKRLPDGCVEEPMVDIEPLSKTPYARMGSVDINRDSATINVTIPKKVKLVSRATRQEIPEVAGILLDNLQDYKRYTIVSDGELNLQSLTVKFATEGAYNQVNSLGFNLGKFNPSSEYDINLSSIPVCPYEFDASGFNFDDISAANIISKILTSLSTGKSAVYSAEQVAALKDYCLSANLYINWPTTNSYADLDQAMQEGKVDSRTSYKVKIGSTTVLNTGKYKSANQFIDRMYTVEIDDNKQKKANMEMFAIPNASFSHKVLSSKIKITNEDLIQKEIYDEILGLAPPNKIAEIDQRCGSSLVRISKERTQLIDSGEFTKVVSDSAKAIKKYESSIWAKNVCPLIFFIGATGLVPEELETEAMTAEELLSSYPTLSMSKTEKDGSFFVAGNKVISVYAEDVRFTVDRKIKTAGQ